MARVLHVLLTHQPPGAVSAMQAWWQEEGGVALEDQLILHGGERAAFEGVAHSAKCYCGDDPRLRTRDHQRDKQGFSGVFAVAAAWLREHPEFTHVHVAEYDHLPLRRDFGDLLLGEIVAEKADVLGFRVLRVDGTSHPHYLYHAAAPRFHAHFAALSRRADPRTILSMFGSGSFWTRAAFECVAAATEHFPVYLELWLPTTAHHLGFRVRRFATPAAEAWIENLGERRNELDTARKAGGWSIHPVKSAWTA